MINVEESIGRETGQQDFTFLRLASAVSRQRFIAITAFLVLAALVAVLVAILPRQYEAEMLILVDNDRPTQVVTPGISSPQNQPSVDETELNSEIELMTNRGLLQKVADDAASPRKTLPTEATAQRSISPDKELKTVQKHLHVEAARKSNVIEVTYTDRNPDRAKFVLTRLLAQYMDAHTRAHATPGTYAFFKGQAENFQAQLVLVEAELAQSEAGQGALDLPQQEDVIVKGREDAETALLASEATVQADASSASQGEVRYAAAPATVETESRSMPNQYSIERMRTLLVELRNKRADLVTNFPPGDRQVQDLDRQIANTEQSVTAAVRDESVERTTGINPVRQSLQLELNRLSMSVAGERARHRALQDEVDLYDRRLAKLAAIKQRYEQLERSRKELQDNFVLYSQKQEEARVAEALDAQRFSNITVIEPPLESHSPSQPKVLLDLILGWSLALCLALVAALITDRYFDGVHDAGTLEELTGLPVLGASTVGRSW